MFLIFAFSNRSSDLLHVFGETVATKFPHSEEMTTRKLASFSPALKSFVLDAKSGFDGESVGDGDFEQPNGVSIVQAINDEQLVSISSQYSNELAAALISYHEKAKKSIDLSLISVFLRKLDANGNRDQVVQMIKDILMNAWKSFDKDTFQKMGYSNIFNLLYPKPTLNDIQKGTFIFQYF